MSNWNGYVSRLAFLEALRQDYLEFAETWEQALGEEHTCVKESRKKATRLLEQIQEAQGATS